MKENNLKRKILCNQIKSLMAVNNKIYYKLDINRKNLFEVQYMQESVNKQLDLYKLELDALDSLDLPK